MPFSPNGMIMSFLRSCYRQRIMFVAGDPTQTTVATWYRCGPDAKVFPFLSAFGSPTWDTDHPTITEIGFDATTARPWYNGRRINSSLGQTYAGDRLDFLNGAAAPGHIPRAFDGTPVECLQPPFGLAGGGSGVPSNVARGGKVVTGSAGPSVMPGVPCSQCVGVTPLIFRLVLSGFTGANAPVNGTWTMTQNAFNPCAWGNFPTPFGLTVASTSFGWLVDVVGIGGNALYSGSKVDCVTGVILPQTFSSIGGGATCQLLIP